MIFDTHAHYNDAKFDEDREELLASLREHGIEHVVNVAASLSDIKETLELVEKYDFLYGSVGVHPTETGELTDAHIPWIRECAAKERIVAVGEIGLDYYWDEPEPAVQKHWFEVQLELAKEIKMPVIIHSRDAAADTLDMMKSLHGEEAGGIIHCFSYGKEMAREYLNMGFYLGIGGVLTFKNSRKLKEVVEYAPMDRLVLETDCPYLSPEPNRGKRNSSLNLPYVVEAMAQIKGMSGEEVIRITSENAKAVYRL